jgi:hypothetical protein
MKKLALLSVLVATFGSAQATCVGSGSLQTCIDGSGNSYTVSRIGNTTNVQGYNVNTGSAWSQNSTTVGNTTYHNGTAANGNGWNGTTTNYGGITNHSGVDSRGNAYSKTCTAYGCN